MTPLPHGVPRFQRHFEWQKAKDHIGDYRLGEWRVIGRLLIAQGLMPRRQSTEPL